ncbi:PREDICTED: serpin-Z1-like [Camelina sativa]|uniref:Serpin-Z1-like n=1 Tax=Camelina sativa TaxID=90675 RepID=A0ABM1QA99_CAMSA|nr:PREDICTED: serpin-Z1-like [Camelina sativa]
MIAQRFAVASSFLLRMNPRMTFVSRMNPKMTIQNLSISSKTADPSQVIPSPSLSKIDLRKAIKKRNDEDLVLTGKIIASKARNSNFIFSPASINSAYTMMAAWRARYGSISDELKAVFSEIATVVFADGSASGGPKISSINGFWVEQTLPVDHSFKDLMEKSFKATYAQVDFRCKAEECFLGLNKWAADQTNGLITDLLPPGSVESKTNEVSGNALYFKGAWAKPFQKSCTKNKKFHLVNGSSVSVPFMSSKEEQYVKAYNGFKVLRLPYRKGHDDTNREFSMYFYLPNKKDGLDELVKKMTSTPGFVDKHIPYHKDKVDNIIIPKFKISFMFKASKEEEKLHIYHSACVEIDEKGATAAAATAMVPYSFCNRPKIDFVAHPFLFLIREDKTGTILFAGQIFDPSKKSS